MPRKTNRPRLGRGLSSLIRNSTLTDSPEYQPTDESVQDTVPTHRHRTISVAGGGISMVPVDSISPNPSQPRQKFDENSLAELADSIRVHGLLQPILIAEAHYEEDEKGTPYNLVAGERRLRASRLAGLEEVPCIIRSASSQEMLELSLIENIQRANLNPIERADAYRNLIDRFGLTQEQVAKRMGEARATIANHLRLLALCNDVQSMVVSGEIEFSHARVLAGLAGRPEVQVGLARRIIRERLSVRKLESLVLAAQRGSSPDVEIKEKKTPSPRSAYMLDVEEQLTRSIGNRVSISPGRSRNSGRITIEYYTLEDFDRITATLGAKIES